MSLVFLIVWVVKPLGRPELDLSLRALVGVLLLGSPLLFRDSRQSLGLRIDNFGQALAGLLPVTLGAVAVSLAAGYWLASYDPPENGVTELTYYFAWALAQQYALQAVVLRRVEGIGLRERSPLVAAALFSLVHAPNPGLMILTFLGGLLWCSTFRRHPNILAVALSHAVLAVIVGSALPQEVTGGLRIGPAYASPR